MKWWSSAAGANSWRQRLKFPIQHPNYKSKQSILKGTGRTSWWKAKSKSMSGRFLELHGRCSWRIAENTPNHLSRRNTFATICYNLTKGEGGFFHVASLQIYSIVASRLTAQKGAFTRQLSTEIRTQQDDDRLWALRAKSQYGSVFPVAFHSTTHSCKAHSVDSLATRSTVN